MPQDLEKARIQDIERTLEQLPRGLFAVYERVLAQIKLNDQETVIGMVRWLLHATRPLRVVELCEALNVQATNQLTREQVCVGYVQACGHLLDLSAGRMFPTHSNDEYISLKPLKTKLEGVSFQPNPDRPEEFLWITFVHQSVREFLSGISQSSTRFHWTITDKRTTHIAITNRLIQCLSVSGLSNNPEDVDRESPLTCYAKNNWFYHMGKLGGDYMKVVKSNPEFFQMTSIARDRWWQWMDERRMNWLMNNGGPDQGLPIVHMACYAGLYDLAKHCLLKRNTLLGWRRERDVNQVWGREGVTSLHLISTRSIDQTTLDIVKLLLDCGAKPTVVNSRGYSALHLALQGAWQDLRLVKLLTSTAEGREVIKAEINSDFDRFPTPFPGTLLHQAAKLNNGPLCRELIENYGYDVNTKNRNGLPPLYDLIYTENTDLAKFFINQWGATAAAGQTLDFLRAVFESDLTYVTAKEAKDIVINDLGIEINGTDSHGNNVLHRSSYFKPSHIMQLIESGINVNARNSKGETILHTAFGNLHRQAGGFSNQWLHFVLKQSQLDINSQDHKGYTPLHAMVNALGSRLGSYTVWMSSLSSLLDLGADRSLEDGEGMTALQLALQYRLGAESRLRSKLDNQEMPARHLSMTIETLLNYTTVPINAQIVPAPNQKMVRFAAEAELVGCAQWNGH